MAKIKHDWATIKAEYVEGIVDADGNRSFPFMEDFAKKSGVAGPQEDDM